MRGSRPLTHPSLLQGHRTSRAWQRLAHRRDEAAPPAPEGLSEKMLPAWERLWGSRVATTWDPESDLGAISRYILNLERWGQYQEVVRQMPMIRGSKGQFRSNPLAARMDALETQLRATEEQYGLTPASRVRLGIELVERERGALDLRRELLRRPGPDPALVVDEDGNEYIDLDRLV